MTERDRQAQAPAVASEAKVVRRVMLCSLLLLGTLVAVSCIASGWPFARSVLIGGLLVNGSFWLLKRDAQRLMTRVGEDEGARTNVEKTRFVLRAFARFVVLGLLLFALASRVSINAVGLTLGLATVMVSVVIIGLSATAYSMPRKV